MNARWIYPTSITDELMIQTSGNTREGLQGKITKILHVGSAMGGALAGGYGVVQATDGEQYFFERYGARDFAELSSGDFVTFTIEAGPFRRAIDIFLHPGSTTDVSGNPVANFCKQRMEIHTMNDETINLGPVEHDAEVRAVLRHAKIEYSTLRYLQSSLLESLDWKTEGNTFSRKLSGVRHGFDMFCEQVDRIFAIEEHDGMVQLLDEMPEYQERVNQLMAEHGPIRDVLDLITIRLERCIATDQVSFSELQRDVRRVVMQIDEHMQRENRFVMDAFNTDIGAAD